MAAEMEPCGPPQGFLSNELDRRSRLVCERCAGSSVVLGSGRHKGKMVNASDIGAVSMEKVDKGHPVHKLGEGGKWMQSARDRMKKKGTVGLFGKKAAAAGMSTQAYAAKEYHAP